MLRKIQNLMELREISWDEILPVWNQHLWPNRSSSIQPMSSMRLLGGNDMSIYSQFKPWFCGLYIMGELAGVNSCHQTSATDMRLRGIFLFDRWRNSGLSDHLFQFVDEIAISQGCCKIWSFPRVTICNAYIKAGYRLISETIYTGEFGPNVYAVKDLL